jgi:hypothetical protein
MDDRPYPKDTQPEKVFKEKERLPQNEVALPRWSPLLLKIQHLNLRMGHRSKSKVKAKLMRSIRKQVPLLEGTHTMETHVVRITTHQPTASLMDSNE